MNQEEHKKSFIEELQALDEPAKKKVFIIATVVIMATVLYVWFGYFNGIVSSASQNPAPAPVVVADGGQAQPVPVAAGASGSNSNFLANIGSDFMDMIHWIANIFQGPGQYNVQPSH